MSQEKSIPRWGYAVLAGASALFLLAIVYTYTMGRTLRAENVPQVDAVIKIQLHITTSHLWLEEFLVGDTSVTDSMLVDHIDLAEFYTQALLDGGTNEHGTFVPLTDISLRNKLRDMRKDIVEYRIGMIRRLAGVQDARAGSPGDTSFDMIYDTLITDAGDIERSLKEHFTRQGEIFRQTVAGLFLASLFAFAFVFMLFRRFNEDRQRFNDSISGQKRLFESMFMSVPDAMIVTDLQRNVIMANPGVRSIFGYDEAEVLGKSPASLFADEAQFEVINTRLDRLLKGDFLKPTIIQFHRRSGVRFAGETVCTVITGADGLPSGVLWLVRDISDRVRAERALHEAYELLEERVEERTLALTQTNALLEKEVSLHQLTEANLMETQRELSTLNAELHDALGKLRDAMNVKEEFFARMSHEIRTPMNGVIGLTELILQNENSPENREMLKMVQSSGESLLRIINDILDFSKLQARRFELESRSFNLRSTLTDTLYMFVHRAKQKGVELRWSIDDRMPDRVTGDPVRLGQVLVNLIGNALKFTDSGTIELEVRTVKRTEQDVEVSFAVKDTGVGIAKEQLDRIFESFAQGSSTIAARYGGTGLGLAISSSLVELMGGRIRVRSQEDVGSEFSFSVRLALPAGAARSTPELPQAESHQVESLRHDDPAPQTEPLQVLLVEDNAVNQKLALRILQKAGHGVTVANDGLEALERYAEEHFDLVLMDLMMPNMDGYKATAEIRGMEATSGKRTPIVALTANAMAGEREKCLAAGMDDYISKPFKSKDLLTLIARIGSLKFS